MGGGGGIRPPAMWSWLSPPALRGLWSVSHSGFISSSNWKFSEIASLSQTQFHTAISVDFIDYTIHIQHRCLAIDSP